MRDTNAPARTPSGYMLFCDAKRKIVTRDNPDCSMIELSTIFGRNYPLICEIDMCFCITFIFSAFKLKHQI